MNFLRRLRQKWHNDILYRIQRHDDVVTKIMDKQEKDKNEILGALSWNNLEVYSI